MGKKIISFDVATKSMGVAIIELMDIVKVEDAKYISNIVSEYLPDALSELVLDYGNCQATNDIIKFEYLDVWDLSDNQGDRLNIVTPAKVLSQYLQWVDREFGAMGIMIYENQMNLNDKSRTMSHYIIYHYAMKDTMIVKMFPHEKNKIHFSPELKYQNFIKKYAKSYTANKAHSKANLQYLAKLYNLDIAHIANKNLDDVADALMQIFAYLHLAPGLNVKTSTLIY